MSTLCMLELAGDFSSESILRKAYDFKKIGRNKYFRSQISSVFLSIFWELPVAPESVITLSSTRNCFSLCEHRLLCNLAKMDYLIKKPCVFIVLLPN